MRSSDDSPLGAEDLTQLDDISLRRKWRRLIGRPMPDGLGRALILRVLAYQQQVQRYGDLDLVSRRALMNVLGAAQGRNLPADMAKADTTASKAFRTSPLLRPGTILTREHGGVLHHVMVMEKGFGWHGRTFDSLSKAAFAITGTRWNGPRFFGLRDKGEPQGSSSSKVTGTLKQSATDRVGRDIAPAQIAPRAL